MQLIDSVGKYRQEYDSGLVTTVAAATSTAGFLFAMRWQSTAYAYLLRALGVEFFLTTAFGAAQEVGFDVMIARGFTASCSGGTALTPLGANDAKERTAYPSSVLASAGDMRIGNTGALTAGTHTLDGRPIAKGSYDASAIRTRLGPYFFDFSQYESGGYQGGGYLLRNNEGFIIRNTILMGATGVGIWKFTPVWSEVLVTDI